mmetsp:Transcript_26579/g.76580  ORF Transcript_26579/g.76580 Transcript_26579/m.76580 type:complete len:254 (+) Transcript_26579:291-1052(+)
MACGTGRDQLACRLTIVVPSPQGSRSLCSRSRDRRDHTSSAYGSAIVRTLSPHQSVETRPRGCNLCGPNFPTSSRPSPPASARPQTSSERVPVATRHLPDSQSTERAVGGPPSTGRAQRLLPCARLYAATPCLRGPSPATSAVARGQSTSTRSWPRAPVRTRASGAPPASCQASNSPSQAPASRESPPAQSTQTPCLWPRRTWRHSPVQVSQTRTAPSAEPLKHCELSQSAVRHVSRKFCDDALRIASPLSRS